MPKRYIQSFRSIFLDPADEAASLHPVKADLPRRAARRMSRLGIMLHDLLKDTPLNLETTVVYGTRYSESSALETYLDSFPSASPTAFQTSIHPGGVEQALILDQQDIGAFFPLAGARPLMMQMLKLAFTADTPEVVLCGGEEKGNWLTDFGLAHHCSFAFVMRVTDNPAKACGELLWEQQPRDDKETMPDMTEAVRLFSEGQTVAFQSASLGFLRIVPT
jgi:hypothetical protein